MAHVAQLAVGEKATFLLDRLFERWSQLPSAEEFETWDLLDQLDLIFEWAIPRSFLFELNKLRDADLLDEGLEKRYQELTQLMERQQPLLDELLKD